MQDFISCYLKLVYLNLEWIVEISVVSNVQDYIDLLNQQFDCEIKGEYLYELKTRRILNNQTSFQENDICSGVYLYLI